MVTHTIIGDILGNYNGFDIAMDPYFLYVYNDGHLAAIYRRQTNNISLKNLELQVTKFKINWDKTLPEYY